MILFLDFDGVLHPAFPKRELADGENQPFSYLPRLENVLRDYSELRIVIVSSWREKQPWENILKAFTPDIAARIIGATPVLKTKEPPYPKHPRHDEVLAYLRTNGLTESFWVGLDDDASLYPPNCRNLIVCADGFRDAEENALRAALSGRRASNPRYFLKNLLAQCDVNTPEPKDAKAWEGMVSVGKEVLKEGKQQ